MESHPTRPTKSTSGNIQELKADYKDKFVVRLPDGLRPRIAEVAKRYHRSMNSEIIQTLEKHLLKPDENKSLDDQLITLISKLSDKQKRAVLTLFWIQLSNYFSPYFYL